MASSSISRISPRTSGPFGDAQEIEAVHWAGLEGAYLGRVRGWPEAPRDIEARVDRWCTWLTDSDVDVIVGEVDDQVVGFCTVLPGSDPDLDSLTTAEIPTLYVHPNHWHRGYGRALCREALRVAKNRDFATAVLWVVDINRRARDFYVSFGFTPDGEARPERYSAERLTAARYRISLDSAV